LALVVASSCGNLGDVRGDIEALKRENERINRMLLEMKKNLVVSFMEFWAVENGNKFLSDFGVPRDELFSSCPFVLKNIDGVWKLCWGSKSVVFRLYLGEFRSFVCRLLESGVKIQGFDTFLKDDKFCCDFFSFLNFLYREKPFVEKNFWVKNEFKEVWVDNLKSLKMLFPSAFRGFFRICENVKIRSKTGDLEDFVVISVTFSQGRVVFKINGGESFFLKVKSKNDFEIFERLCGEKGWKLEKKFNEKNRQKNSICFLQE